MQPFGHNRYGPKIGDLPLWGRGAGPHLTQRGQAEAYLYAKFHLDPSNRLTTVQQRYRETNKTDRQRSDSRANRFWATICKTVRPMLSDRCLSCVSRPKPHCVRWGPSFPQKGHSLSPIFGTCLLWQNGRPAQLLLSTCTNGRPKVKV